MVTAILLVSFLGALSAVATGQQWAFQDELPSEQQHPSGLAKADSVKVGVYYESLCPDSIRFVKEQLWNTYQKLSDIVDIELIPYGKASFQPQGNDRWTFRCQHGPSECRGNMMQACAIKYNHAPEKIVPFVHCVMTADNPPTSGEQCSQKIGLDWNAIKQCWEGQEGESLLHKMGLQTQSLTPRMHFIPWITINGVHTNDIQDQALTNLQSLVCRTYQGQRPSNCT